LVGLQLIIATLAMSLEGHPDRTFVSSAYYSMKLLTYYQNAHFALLKKFIEIPSTDNYKDIMPLHPMYIDINKKWSTICQMITFSPKAVYVC